MQARALSGATLATIKPDSHPANEPTLFVSFRYEIIARDIVTNISWSTQRN